MSAPKPRVSRTVTFIGQPGKAATAHRWTWVCECGASDPSPHGLVLHRLAMNDATLHSRTHTAERIADEFARLSDNALDKASLGSRFSGFAYAFAKAEALVRKHLVN